MRIRRLQLDRLLGRRSIADVRKRYGEEAIGLFVLSMAQGPDDALAVTCIARAAGYERDGAAPIEIAPLFEAVDDLERASATLEALLAAPDVVTDRVACGAPMAFRAPRS